MKIKNLDWIRKPVKIKYIKSNEIEFPLENSEHYLLYTFKDDETFSIKYKKDEGVTLSLNVLFTPTEEINLEKQGNRIVQTIELLGLSSTTLIEDIDSSNNTWTVKKEGDTLFFYYDDLFISKFKFSTIEESVSVGIKASGDGLLRVSFN